MNENEFGFQNQTPENQQIGPNYVNEQSSFAERSTDQLLEKAELLGVNVTGLDLDPAELISLVEVSSPQRVALVKDKLDSEGLSIDQLPINVLSDRLLGVDRFFRFNDQLFALDVTSGRHTVVRNKVNKFKAMKPIFDQIGINHPIVLRLKEEPTDDVVLSLFSRLDTLSKEENCPYCFIFRFPETKQSKRQSK